jgi:two-component system, response regulator YesN
MQNGRSSVGIFGRFLLSYRNSKPIRRLASQAGHRRSEMDLIEGALSRLLESNHDLEEEMKRRMPLLRVGFFERLLRGSFYTEDEAGTLLSYVNMASEGSGYLIAVVRIAGHETEIPKQDIRLIDSKRLITSKMLEQLMGTGTYIHEKDADKLVLFRITREDEDERLLEELIEEAALELTARYGIRIACGIGERRSRLSDAHLSLEEALAALDHMAFEQRFRVHWFKAIPKKQIGYYYPIDLEARFANLVRIGEFDEASDLLHVVLDINFGERDLTTSDIRQLISELQGTVCKLRDDILVNGSRHKAEIVNNLLAVLDACLSPKELENRVVTCLRIFTVTVEERKNSHNVTLTRNITAYILEKFRDPNLTLYMVASNFGLSETYLSQFFKEQTGNNYSAFLETTRIEEARRLLLEENITVAEVASKVGYMTNSTFYRAFKRVYGVSPTTYREDAPLLANRTTEQADLSGTGTVASH